MDAIEVIRTESNLDGIRVGVVLDVGNYMKVAEVVEGAALMI